MMKAAGYFMKRACSRILECVLCKARDREDKGSGLFLSCFFSWAVGIFPVSIILENDSVSGDSVQASRRLVQFLCGCSPAARGFSSLPRQKPSPSEDRFTSVHRRVSQIGQYGSLCHRFGIDKE